MDSDAVNHVKSLIGHFKFSPFRGILLKDGFVPQNSFHDVYSVDGRTLGEGGFGKVFSATRNDNGRRVAVKFVKIRPSQRFQQIPGDNLKIPMEMYLHSEVSSIEGVVTIYDYYERADAYLIVMERVDRVQELLKFYLERGRLEECVAKEIFVQVVKIVQNISAAGVFHRDLKPENILISPHSLSVTLIDFGCGAKVAESPFLNEYSGTPDYAPPEWFLDSKYGWMEATTWSLGVLLYELVVGKIPFRNPKEIVANSGLWFPPGTSENCQNLILDCLRSRPHKRLSLQEILDHFWCLPGSGFGHVVSPKEVSPAASQHTENSDLTNIQQNTEPIVELESFLSSSSEISASEFETLPSDESFDMTVRHSHENAPFDVEDDESESPKMRSSEQIWHLWEAAIPYPSASDLESNVDSETVQSQEDANNNATLDALLLDQQESNSHSVSMETTVVSFLADLLRSANRTVDPMPAPAAQLTTSELSPNHLPEDQPSSPPFNPRRNRAALSPHRRLMPYSRPRPRPVTSRNPNRH